MAHVIASRVSETSTSTGTGDFTLAGAETAHKTLASRCSVNDTVDYVIEAVDANGSPAGDWEVGIGTYSAANTLTRTTVQESSNSDALVSFAAGSKRVFIAPTATRSRWAREKLLAARTYYVRTDGSDSNIGLENTSGGAFLTIQKAIDVISYTLDCNGQTITVQVGDGTYTAGFAMRAITGGTTITIQGNSGTPTNVVISTTGSTCATNAIGGTTLSVKDMKLTTTTSGSCILSSSGGYVSFSGINFGACANWHISCQQFGRIGVSGNYTISGGAGAHYFFSGYGYIAGGSKTVTLSGTPAFSSAFAYSNTPAGCEIFSFTFTGAATGKRYDVSANSVLYTGGGGATYFPGDVAGTTLTGAQYI